jgi:WD40 repeat protein
VSTETALVLIPVSGALLTQDGRRILSWSSDKTLRLWDANTGEPVGSVMRHDGPVSGVLLTQDEKRILSRSGNTLQLWDPATGQPIGSAIRHSGPVSGVLLTQDGRRILSWARDTLRLWDITWPNGNLLELACSLLPNRDRNLKDISQRYGISITEPICGSEQINAPLNWSKIERIPTK